MNSVKFAGDLCPPVAASCGAEDLTAPRLALSAADPEVIERRRRAAAERQKRARTREALGLVVLPIELHEAQIADALIEARLLTEDETADRGRVAAAVPRSWPNGRAGNLRHASRLRRVPIRYRRLMRTAILARTRPVLSDNDPAAADTGSHCRNCPIWRSHAGRRGELAAARRRRTELHDETRALIARRDETGAEFSCIRAFARSRQSASRSRRASANCGRAFARPGPSAPPA